MLLGFPLALIGALLAVEAAGVDPLAPLGAVGLHPGLPGLDGIAAHRTHPWLVHARKIRPPLASVHSKRLLGEPGA